MPLFLTFNQTFKNYKKNHKIIKYQKVLKLYKIENFYDLRIQKKV